MKPIDEILGRAPKAETKSAVTVKDVAARAGVTPTVVSRVLHNKASGVRVSEATAERVRQAAVDLGYRVNVFARNFRDRQTMMLGVLHGIGFGRPRLDHGPRYFASLMDGIVDGAFEYGYSVTLCPKLLGQSPEDAMTDGRFDGLIWYSTSPSGENRSMLEKCSVPLVLIHTPAAEMGGKFPSVSCDNRQGIGLAIDHLVDMGHQRIAFVLEGSDLFGEASVRRDAYMWHMGRRGLSCGPSDVLDIATSGFESYLSMGRRHTAFITTHDGVAARIMEIAGEHGIRVPEDISIIGFDSTAFCKELRPSLTSISQPLVNMGQTAVSLLVKSITGEAPDPLDIVYPCGLDIRGSTQSIRS